jgi:hypothetical protein
MSVDPRDIQKSMNEDRYKRALPTRDSHTHFPGATRAASEGDARMEEVAANKFKDWFLRAKGRDATTEEVNEYMGKTAEDAGAA